MVFDRVLGRLEYWIARVRGWYWRKTKKNVRGHSLEDEQLQVYVSTKYSNSKAKELKTKGYITERDLVPESARILRRYDTDVIDVGDVRAYDEEDLGQTITPKQDVDEMDTEDVEIRPEEANWVGTAGAIATRAVISTRKKVELPKRWTKFLKDNFPSILEGADEDVFIVTNRHVAPEVGSKIVHPYNGDIIGEVEAVTSWDKDGSLVRLTTYTGFIRLDRLERAQKGMYAEKLGRTTGHTKGRCIGTGAVIDVKHSHGVETHTDSDIYQGVNGQFLDAGDSGSIARKDDTLVGTTVLAFGSSKISGGAPASQVYQRLGVNV